MNPLRITSSSSLSLLLVLGSCIGAAAATSTAAAEERVVHRVVFEGEDGDLVHLLPRLGRRPFLGVSTVEMTPELREHLGAPRGHGVLVSSVGAGSPAERGGVAVGDVLTRLGDASIDSTLDLLRAVARQDDDAPARLEVWRGGELLHLEVALEERALPSFDVGPLVLRLPDGGPGRLLTIGPGELGELRLDPERLDRLGAEIGERLRSEEWVERLQGLQSGSPALEGRIHELEERLRELERELSRLLDEAE